MLPDLQTPAEVSPGGALADRLGRPLRSLRVSVTDRCNLRCNYCMPQEEYVWLPRQELLTFEEIARLVEVFTSLGVEDVRLTGGEPLLRRDLPQLVRMLAANPRIRDLALTTNGVLFAEQGEALRAAGLHRVTLSLDTLRPERFSALAGRDTHAQVLAGIAAARRLGFPKLKLDTVVLRGVNDDELADLIEYGRGLEAEVRFIEYMDVGGATEWSLEKVFTRAEMLEQLTQALRHDHAAQRKLFRARRAVPASGRHRVRHHRFDHDAVLQELRPQPPDRGRALVSVPVRASRDRSPPDAARGRCARGNCRAHFFRLARANGSRRGVARRHRPARRAGRDRAASPGSAPRNAHPRRLDPKVSSTGFSLSGFDVPVALTKTHRLKPALLGLLNSKRKTCVDRRAQRGS